MPSGWAPSSGEGGARGLRRCSLSSLMEWPWLARMSQWEGSVEDSSRAGLVAGLGLRAKRCLSELWTALRISGKVGARERSGPHWSWWAVVSISSHSYNNAPACPSFKTPSNPNNPNNNRTRRPKQRTHHALQARKPLLIKLHPGIPRLMPQQP